jgi:hypothetical protein
VFPFAGATGRRVDLDHTIPFQPGGPPGQTSPGRTNLLIDPLDEGMTTTTATDALVGREYPAGLQGHLRTDHATPGPEGVSLSYRPETGRMIGP